MTGILKGDELSRSGIREENIKMISCTDLFTDENVCMQLAICNIVKYLCYVFLYI